MKWPSSAVELDIVRNFQNGHKNNQKRKHPMKVMSIALAAWFSLAAVSMSVAADLIKDGRAVSAIVLSADASSVERHAAEELALYLGKIAGSNAPAIVSQSPENLCPIFLGTVNDSNLVARLKDRTLPAKLDPEGFLIDSGSDRLIILGKEPIGALYGAYEILKKYGGIRWITPGADGEYFTVKPTVAVPEQNTVHNPSFHWRRLFCGGCGVNSPLTNTWDWMVRNDMRVTDVNSSAYRAYRVSGEPRILGKILEERGALADEIGGFSQLLAGIGISRNYKEGYAYLAQMFAEHPERFPLINGKRVPLTGNQRYQPCTSNPEVIEIMRANIDTYLATKMKPGDEFTLFNDDGTGWCQCDNCTKLDPPAEKELRFVSTRFWVFANQLLGPLVAKYPHIKLGAIAYQNFQRAPVGVTPDKNLYVHKAYNRRCYRHNLDDPSCPINQKFYEYFKEWSALGNPSYTWDQIDSSAMAYMPTERTFVNGLKTFHKLGVNGARPVVAPPDGNYNKRYDGTLTKDCWWGMWPTLYLAAQFLWNIDGDYDALYEEAGALYYGQAWPAMKEYRALMVKAATNSPGCFGHGGGSPIGRVLTQPGVQDKLNELLAKAEQAAKDDPKARLHVQRDRTFFSQVWEKELKSYMENYRELRVYRRAAPIVIDGVLDDADWKNADTITGFKSAGNGVLAGNAQTFVKVVYEPEFICFGIETMEPTPDRMLTEIRERDGQLWLDNTLEIFITHPDLAGDYFHLIFNANGVLYDAFNRRAQKAADLKFDSCAEVKTKVLADRWIAEVRIPTAPLGMQAFDGQVWRINVARARVLTNNYRETSSWSGGAFHGAEYYPTVSFAGKRALSGVERGMSFIEKDTRAWKNAGFNEVVRRDPERGPGLNWKLGADELLPRNWSPGSAGGELEMIKNTEGDYSLHLKKGIVFQMHPGLEKKYSINLRLKGKGKMHVWMFRYPRLGTSDQIDQAAREKGAIPSKMLDTLTVDSTEWRDYKFSYTNDDLGVINALALGINEGSILVDDVFMTPAGDKVPEPAPVDAK